MRKKATLNTHNDDNKILVKTNEFSMFSKKIFDYYELTEEKNIKICYNTALNSTNN